MQSLVTAALPVLGMIACYGIALPAMFHAAWPSILAAFGGSGMAAMVFGVQLVHLVVYILNHCFYALLYLDVPFMRWLQRYRVNPKPWPWSSAAPAAVRATFWTHVAWTGPVWLFNNVLLGLPLAYLTYKTPVVGGYGDASMEGWPSTPQLLLQLLICILVEDVIFYFTHRLLHTPWLYKRVHKWHHAYTHTISIAAEYAHPVEYVLGNSLPFIAGPRIVGAHVVTLYVWMILRITSTSEGHSGYCFPFSVSRLWPPSGEAHDAHHSMNTGNFGSAFPFWDWVLGTHIDDDVVVASNLRKQRTAAKSD